MMFLVVALTLLCCSTTYGMMQKISDVAQKLSKQQIISHVHQELLKRHIQKACVLSHAAIKPPEEQVRMGTHKRSRKSNDFTHVAHSDAHALLKKDFPRMHKLISNQAPQGLHALPLRALTTKYDTINDYKLLESIKQLQARIQDLERAINHAKSNAFLSVKVGSLSTFTALSTYKTIELFEQFLNNSCTTLSSFNVATAFLSWLGLGAVGGGIGAACSSVQYIRYKMRYFNELKKLHILLHNHPDMRLAQKDLHESKNGNEESTKNPK